MKSAVGDIQILCKGQISIEMSYAVITIGCISVIIVYTFRL
jgi:hypothetical protein